MACPSNLPFLTNHDEEVNLFHAFSTPSPLMWNFGTSLKNGLGNLDVTPLFSTMIVAGGAQGNGNQSNVGAHPLAHGSNDTVSSNIKFIDLFSNSSEIPSYELRVSPDGKGFAETPLNKGAGQPLAHSPKSLNQN